MMANFRGFLISVCGFCMGFLVIGTWVLFINVPLPQAQASGSNLLSKTCKPAAWIGEGPQSSHGNFKATKSITCEITLDHREGNPETLKSLVLHDLEASARQILAEPIEVSVAGNSGAKASALELIHEREIVGSTIMIQDKALVSADPSHFRFNTTSQNILRGTFFASQLKRQDRDVAVLRLPPTSALADCGRFQVTLTMDIEFQKTLRTEPPAIFTSDAESLATKAFDQSLSKTLEELGRQL